MKFLTKLGQILLKGTQLIIGLEPLIAPQLQPAVVKTVDTLEQIAQIVVTVEAFGQVLNTPGPDKLRAATPSAVQAVLQSALLAGKKINDPVLFSKGCGEVTGGIADILNSLKDAIDTHDVG